MKRRTKAPEATRLKILDAAFSEFYRNGFQGGSLNQIVEAAGVTKGALFYHFPEGKQKLGYAVIEEIIGPSMEQRWLTPLADAEDPIAELKRLFRRYIKEAIATGDFIQGCPLNNLAQEMSPLDDGFHTRINGLYNRCRKGFARALAAGIKSRKVRANVVPRSAAALIVASQMGIWGSGKSSKNGELMLQAGEAVCGYLDALRP